jgi:hypothetical protein
MRYTNHSAGKMIGGWISRWVSHPGQPKGIKVNYQMMVSPT